MRLILNFLFLLTIIAPSLFGLNINWLTSEHDQRNVSTYFQTRTIENM